MSAAAATKDDWMEAIRHPELFKPCPNSLNAKHKWREPVVKNANKPLACEYCTKLADDLRLTKGPADGY